MQLGTYQMMKLPFVLYSVDICVYEIIFAGVDETAMKTLLYNPGMEFLPVHKCMHWKQSF